MNFEKFDSRAAAAAGSWLHLAHPSLGHLLYADEDNKLPCRVLLMGSEASKAQEILGRLTKAKAKDAAARATDGKDAKAVPVIQTPAEVHNDLCDLVRPLVMGFENIFRGNTPATAEDADWFLHLQITNGHSDERSFAEQCSRHIFRRSSYLGNEPAA